MCPPDGNMGSIQSHLGRKIYIKYNTVQADLIQMSDEAENVMNKQRNTTNVNGFDVIHMFQTPSPQPPVPAHLGRSQAIQHVLDLPWGFLPLGHAWSASLKRHPDA